MGSSVFLYVAMRLSNLASNIAFVSTTLKGATVFFEMHTYQENIINPPKSGAVPFPAHTQHATQIIMLCDRENKTAQTWSQWASLNSANAAANQTISQSAIRELQIKDNDAQNVAQIDNSPII
jgi:hypothetical protein